MDRVVLWKIHKKIIENAMYVIENANSKPEYNGIICL